MKNIYIYRDNKYRKRVNYPGQNNILEYGGQFKFSIGTNKYIYKVTTERQLITIYFKPILYRYSKRGYLRGDTSPTTQYL